MATKKTTETPARKRRISIKSEAERERLETLVEANEERLASGQAVNGETLTPHQQQTLREVVRVQREKLDQIHASQ